MSELQRKFFAKGFIDLANIGAGAMVFGQFISENLLDGRVLILGILVTIVFYIVAYELSK